jgi:hypothetical protein
MAHAKKSNKEQKGLKKGKKLSAQRPLSAGKGTFLTIPLTNTMITS